MGNRVLYICRYSLIVKLSQDSAITFKSPIGLIRVTESTGKVTSIDLALSGSKETSSANPTLLQAKTEIDAYFAGTLTKFTMPVDLTKGTPFQRAVWKEISKIKFGQVKTYADIARAIGKPLAARAVGGAVGSNPIPLVIGCHRVLGSSGKITGYSGGKGLPTKRILLKLEGIASKE